MLGSPDLSSPLGLEPDSVGGNGPSVVLADASSVLERRLIDAWVERHLPPGTSTLAITPSRRRRPGARTDPAVAARLQRGDDPVVIPVRIIWLPDADQGRRSANWSDLLKLGDPRDPGPIRQRLILAKDRARVGMVAGASARASELTGSHAASFDYVTLTEHVTRRAHLALERAERHVRGNRYKVPRFLESDILSRPSFRDQVMLVGSERGLRPEQALARARHYLREMSASHSTFLIDLIANAIHWIYSQGYGDIRYSTEALGRIGTLGESHPIAFVPSHRSQLDRLSLQYVLWENDLPPNHTAAGINMNFFPVGPLIRRTGAFFIRRSFKDNPLYKLVVKSYLGYLVEKRFPLEWYMEGGRSRTGKLLPPKMGMLGWVVDAVRQGRSDDLFLIPTSIAYDQIQDVGDYATESIGGEKRPESFRWAIDAIRSLRRRYGNIHIRFAEPISVAAEVDLADDDRLDLQKLAFEVMYRISMVTPITPTAVVSIALLAAGGRPVSPEEVAAHGSLLAGVIAAGGWPTTEPMPFDRPDTARRILDQLVAHGSVTNESGTYHLIRHQAVQAAYYRNMIVHFFVPGAIAELALSALAEGAAATGDPLAAFWDEVFRIRDLLKFEFFFAERDEFHRELTDELDRAVPGWQHTVAGGDADTVLGAISPRRAHWAVLPFLEAYQVVADELVDADGPISDEKEFLDAALDRGARDRQSGRLESHESVTRGLMQSALDLARNKGLVAGGSEARVAFAAEIRAVCERASRIRITEREATR